MQAAVIDGEFAVAVLGVDVSEAFAPTNVGMGVIFLALHLRGHDDFGGNGRGEKESVACFEA